VGLAAPAIADAGADLNCETAGPKMVVGRGMAVAERRPRQPSKEELFGSVGGAIVVLEGRGEKITLRAVARYLEVHPSKIHRNERARAFVDDAKERQKLARQEALKPHLDRSRRRLRNPSDRNRDNLEAME